MNFTVAVVTRDRPRYLDRLLESLANQIRAPAEIIVVDNGSDDRTRAVVRRYESSIPVVYIERGTDADLPGGRNTAIDAASGDVICFLDDDTVAEPSWLEGIERGYEIGSDVVAVGGPSIASDETLSALGEITTSSENMNCLNRYGEESDHSNHWIPPEPVRTDKLQGSNMSFKIDILAEVGGFDSGYGGYPLFEDTDVFARLWKRDERVIYHPEALVYHLRAIEGGWPSERNSEYWYWFARNSIRYRKRNFPERYHLSLLRLLLYTEYHPPPIWKQFSVVLLTRKSRYLRQLRGYFDGVLFE